MTLTVSNNASTSHSGNCSYNRHWASSHSENYLLRQIRKHIGGALLWSLKPQPNCSYLMNNGRKLISSHNAGIIKKIKPKLILPVQWFLMFLKFQILISRSKIDQYFSTDHLKAGWGIHCTLIEFPSPLINIHIATMWGSMYCNQVVSFWYHSSLCWSTILQWSSGVREQTSKIIFNPADCNISF